MPSRTTATLAFISLNAISSVEASCSVSTCEDLGWTESQAHRSEEHLGSEYVCGETNLMMGNIHVEGAFLECSGYLNYASATAFCESNGARLCTLNELVNDETRYTGCNYDHERVWSSSTNDCAPGTYHTVGGSTVSSLLQECTDENDSSTIVARCCADYADSPTCPSGSGPSTAEQGSGSSSGSVPGGSCFHGDSTVLLESGASKRLSEVRIGDRIKTTDENGVFSFSNIVSLPHKANTEEATFVSLKTETGKSVDMTPDHYIPMCDFKVVTAGELVTGDCLLTMDGKETLVEIASTEKAGVYTAVTHNKFIVVDGIVASSFSKDDEATTPETMFEKYKLEWEGLRKKLKKAMLRGGVSS